MVFWRNWICPGGITDVTQYKNGESRRDRQQQRQPETLGSKGHDNERGDSGYVRHHQGDGHHVVIPHDFVQRFPPKQGNGDSRNDDTGKPGRLRFIDRTQHHGQVPFLTHAVERSCRSAGGYLQACAGRCDYHEQCDPGHGRRQVNIRHRRDGATITVFDDGSQLLDRHRILPADRRDTVDKEGRRQHQQHGALHCANRNTRLLDVVDRRIEVGEHPHAEQHSRPDH
ncbi:hypothetical protein D3C80_1007730 [compost metagenome]